MSTEDDPNPYRTGLADVDVASPSGLQEGPVREMLSQRLLSLRRWQFVASVLLFLLAGATILMFLAMFLPFAGAGASPLELLVGGFVVVVFYLLPATLLWRAGQAARDLAVQQSSDLWLHFIQQQLGFWRYVGVLMIITPLLYVVMIFAAWFAMRL